MNQELLTRCSNAAGPSGFEGGIRAIIREELGSLTNITTTTAGNIICELPGSGPTVGLMAHMDEIGFMVQGITPDGFLLIVPLGGWWNHTLPSQRMLVHTRAGRSIPGQVGTKPPHLLPESQRSSVMPNDALFIDIGASCAAEVADCGITIGCAVTPDVQLQGLEIPHRWMGKAFDNRAGVYCMIEAMKRLAADKPACTVQGIGTVQEEVGTRGARAMEKLPDLVIVLEGPPADDTFGQSGTCRQGVLGRGAQVRLFDPTNITPPRLGDYVLGLAAEQGIPCQATVRRTGGTDAAASYPQWHGTPAIVFGVPTRYIHSHNGILDDRDLDACVDLTCAAVRGITQQLLDFLQD